VWGTSWGVSTRLMGALIMAHSDDSGLVLPPKLAPIQVVIVPIYKNEEQLAQISEKVGEITKQLKKLGISVKYDNSDAYKPGYKFAEYELKGVPVRLALGARDLENGTVEVARRDTKTKETVSLEGIATHIQELLDNIQESIYNKALAFKQENTFRVDTFEEFNKVLDKRRLYSSALGRYFGNRRKNQGRNQSYHSLHSARSGRRKRCLHLFRKTIAGRVVFARAY
jgi:prolyl-tRNA synthetase